MLHPMIALKPVIRIRYFLNQSCNELYIATQGYWRVTRSQMELPTRRGPLADQRGSVSTLVAKSAARPSCVANSCQTK